MTFNTDSSWGVVWQDIESNSGFSICRIGTKLRWGTVWLVVFTYCDVFAHYYHSYLDILGDEQSWGPIAVLYCLIYNIDFPFFFLKQVGSSFYLPLPTMIEGPLCGATTSVCVELRKGDTPLSMNTSADTDVNVLLRSFKVAAVYTCIDVWHAKFVPGTRTSKYSEARHWMSQKRGTEL